MTQAAAPASLTRRMTLFATVHVPLVHPLMAAKCMTTVDRASHGRAALNIVAGFLDRLAAYGVRPEDVTMVIKPICTSTMSAGIPASWTGTGY